MNNENVKKFMDTYAEQLEIAHTKFPHEFSWKFEELMAVTSRMQAAILRGNFSKESRAIKATCKILGINHTYKAIREYLGT